MSSRHIEKPEDLCPGNYPWRFRCGLLILDHGQIDRPEKIVETKSSNGITAYTTILWKHAQVASCNCPGWANRRYCKHIAILYEAHESILLADDARKRAPEAVQEVVRRFRGLLIAEDGPLAY